MKLPLLSLLPLILLFACGKSGSTQAETAAPEAETAWQSLFNGKNLDGWAVKINGYELGDNFANTFRVEDGILKVSYDDYERYDQRYGALITEQAFTDYRLKVEYRFVGDTATGSPSWGFRDSGIQYHGQSPQSMGKDQNFPICLEFNLHGGDGVKERPNGQICTIGTKIEINGEENSSFCTPPTVSRTFHGDQWVTAEIEVQGDTISHWVNGEKILTFTNPHYDPKHELGKTFIQGDQNRLRSGHISLQSNSHPIEFRKIEWRPI
jgi:hypothetical protein